MPGCPSISSEASNLRNWLIHYIALQTNSYALVAIHAASGEITFYVQWWAHM